MINKIRRYSNLPIRTGVIDQTSRKLHQPHLANHLTQRKIIRQKYHVRCVQLHSRLCHHRGHVRLEVETDLKTVSSP